MSSNASSLPRSELRPPAELHRRRAVAALAVGRHVEAVEAARHGRRGAQPAAAGALALLECEALFGLLRPADVLAVTNRALRRVGPDVDLRARLRVARAQALWLLGRATASRAEVLRASEEAQTGLTRARVVEAMALLAWRQDQDFSGAREGLVESRRLFDEGGCVEGVARVLGAHAAVLRDEGRMAEALRVQALRVEVAETTTRLDSLAQAHNDRGDLLAYLGRWEEARRDLDRAADLFRSVGSPREAVVTAPQRAMLDLARGDLAAVRQAVEAASGVSAEAGDPRTPAEHRLLASDLHLAAGEPAEAETSAAEALRLFRVARDGAGSCRARVRRVHALLALGRSADALREGHRSVREAGTAGLGSLAWLALGRALLRGNRPGAAKAFERASRLCTARPAFVAGARLGRALALGARRDDAEVGAALKALEDWGDRRLLAYGLADLSEILGPEREVVSPPMSAPVETGHLCRDVAALADAAEALQGEGSWSASWVAAMNAVRPALPWFRAAWVSATGLLLRCGESTAGSLEDDDLARAVTRQTPGPAVLSLRAGLAWGSHPTAALHGIDSVAVAPAGQATLYVDVRVGDGVLEPKALGLLTRLARLMGRHAGEGLGDGHAPSAPGFPEILGRSAPMEALFAQMGLVARSDVTVHLFGATGTGKERVATALHRHSARAAGPFVAVNASSLSDELFESEMFGHVKGAFTGAVGDRRGHVMEADGGTLFIDEVADLTTRAQAKLLRFLQEGEFRRLGEGEARRVNVRIVTAANVPLADRVAAGRFREDLLYRLTTFTLALPSLQERGDDVLLLARHFLRLAAGKEGRPAPPLPATVGRVLSRHAWPGNVRELQNEMSRLVVLGGSGPVRVEHISPTVSSAPWVRRTLSDARTACERDLIARTLPIYGGSRSRTASALGISRQALVTKMRHLGL